MGCVPSRSASCDFNKPYSVSKVEAGLRKKTGFVTVRNESRGSAAASPGVRKCFAAIFTTAQFKLSPLDQMASPVSCGSPVGTQGVAGSP